MVTPHESVACKVGDKENRDQEGRRRTWQRRRLRRFRVEQLRRGVPVKHRIARKSLRASGRRAWPQPPPSALNVVIAACADSVCACARVGGLEQGFAGVQYVDEARRAALVRGHRRIHHADRSVAGAVAALADRGWVT